ncbi:glycoside hydrolase family 43 protein [Catenovulum adriaticum]|uniref:Family 43 glycosylhydrolase n=1 Tax=Catenovulum adriaticum TaxID=2984846 RepID=A0ABY7AQN5_9ALTE|nr:family 43 glycosylhydrolase [Catenovulum sp. TS8]WAJ71799.1 family 43 glycosylhydrolase [Catenovulum sp. TS8]
MRFKTIIQHASSYLCTIMFITACSQVSNEPPAQTTYAFNYQNPISSGIGKGGLRDAQVFRDGDWWYMTGTSYPHWSRQEDEASGQLNKGVILYRSKNLINWESRGYIVQPVGKHKWYYRRFWAPEVQKIDGKYYALFNARNDTLGYVGQFTGYAVANHIEGPYKVVTDEKPLTEGNDLTFYHEDGKTYAFWNKGKEFGIGFAEIDLATGTLLSKPQSAIKPGPVDFDYDENGNLLKVPGYDGRPIPKVKKYYEWDSIGIEGAYVVKRQDTYYLFYSSWTRGYEIGYATAKSLKGPWIKNPDNPFYGAMSKIAAEKSGFTWQGDINSPFNQVGHNAIFTGPDGKLWLSCHGIDSSGIPSLVIDPIWFDEQGNVHSNGPSYTKQTIMLTSDQAKLVR